jgi:hypothetical protein
MKQTDFLKAIKGMPDKELAALRLLLEQNIKLDTSVPENDQARIWLAASIREAERRAEARGDDDQPPGDAAQ